MGFRRGLLFGFFVGAVGVVMSRRAHEEIDSPAEGSNGAAGENGLKALLEEARSAAREESESVDAELRRRFLAARETGSLADEG